MSVSPPATTRVLLRRVSVSRSGPGLYCLGKASRAPIWFLTRSPGGSGADRIVGPAVHPGPTGLQREQCRWHSLTLSHFLIEKPTHLHVLAVDIGVAEDVNEEGPMFDWLKPVLDPYDRKARRRPALLCSVPLVALIVLLIPQLGPIWGSISGGVVYSGGSMLLIQVSRDLGKGLEERLFQTWGGRPSAAMLRNADGRLDKPTKERYRTFLSESIPGLTLASAEGERENPEKAHAGYESANRWLLEQTRDHARFGLLFTENINYGFRRNLLGLKPIALGVDAMAVVSTRQSHPRSARS